MTIKEFRIERGLKQGELAEALGISVSSERSYEYGIRQPSAAVIEKIKELYGVDLAAPAAEEKPAKRGRRKKEEAAPVEEKPALVEEKPAPAEKKTARAKKTAPVAEKKAPKFIIQSRMGGEIAVDEILAKVGDVDTLYIKPEDNAAYWVKGDQSGAVNLW